MNLRQRIAGALTRTAQNLMPSDMGLPSRYDFYSRDGITDDLRRETHAEAYFSNAWRACCLAKARPLASLPVHVYERDGEGVKKESGKRAAKDLAALLRGRWNPYMTATEGLRWLDMTKDTLGNAFLRIEWVNARPKAIWPLSGRPDVRIGAGNQPVFEYGGDKFTQPGNYLSYEIVWVKSPVLDKDCLYGRSLADLASDELGLSIDLERFYASVLNGNGNFPGWLEAPSKIAPQDLEKLKKQLEDGGGLVNAGKIRIFDNGLTYKSTGQSMVDMSLVEQEKWILQQTCRTLSVPPQEVFDLSNATYSNIEQGALNFASKTLVPECTEIERAFTLVLHSIGLTDCFVQFNMDGLLRGSFADRMEGYRTAIFSGWFTRQDARIKEDMPPIPGLDKPLLPTAYALIDPETGEIETIGGNGADEGGNDPQTPPEQPEGQPEQGGSGEGAPPWSGDGDGEAMGAIHEDMEARIQARVREAGDTPKTREFAAKVLNPFAAACVIAHREYDMEQDIEGIIANA